MSPNIYRFAGVLSWLLVTAVSSAPPLPYQSSEKHLGVATCASSVCHGSIQANKNYKVALNEYVIWSQRDRHAKAYETLLSKDSKAIAAKLGLRNAHTAKICLDCHTDNIPKEKRGEGFQLTDGVGCEACHGGSENWIDTHTNKETSHLENVKRGMYPTANLVDRAALCLSCHYGNEDKFATHQIMGAGHPRLSFELDTFQALQPPHFQIDEDYRKRKPIASHTKTWAFGQIAATQSQLRMLQGSLITQPLVFPELALFDCHSCHNNSMHKLDWHRRMNSARIKPGNVPIADGHLRMAIVIAHQVDKQIARKLIELSEALQIASGENRSRIVAVSHQLASIVEKLSHDLAAIELGHSEKEQILFNLIDMGIEGAFRDYIGAEQAVMAIELIIIDINKNEQSRRQIDDLYKQVENDETYQPIRFVDTLQKLKAALN